MGDKTTTETNGFCSRLQQASQPEKVVQQSFEFDIDPRRLSAFPDTDKKGLTRRFDG